MQFSLYVYIFYQSVHFVSLCTAQVSIRTIVKMNIVVFSLLCVATVEPARILGVFPMPSISHQVVFRALTLELAKRGHELVVITTNPVTKGNPIANLTEIDISESYDLIKTLFELCKDMNQLKRGVISDIETMVHSRSTEGMFFLMAHMFKNDEVKKLMHDKTQKFDLVIAEAILHTHLVFGKIFNAPIILFSSLSGFPEVFDIMGAATRHPFIYPSIFRNKFSNLTLLEKLREIYYEYKLTSLYWHMEQLENQMLQEMLGDGAPTVNDLKQHISMLFLNTFPIFDNNRPVPPSIVYLGALHLQPVKELPVDLKQYLDNSKRGVIFVSLGTNVIPALMEKDLLDAFRKAFEILPYDILWKLNGVKLENVSSNVRIQEWFPQRDLLFHPNIKLFVTQGGLQSTDEAIDAGVPLVGIPMLGDQWYNVNKYVELGVGVQVDSLTMKAEDLVEAVKTVLSNDRYRENIMKLKAVMYDQPQKPMDRAVWWTEHVLRHGGAKHLTSPAANMPWTKYFMLDVLGLVLTALVAILVTAIFAIYLIHRIFKTLSKVNKLKMQ